MAEASGSPLDKVKPLKLNEARGVVEWKRDLLMALSSCGGTWSVITAYVIAQDGDVFLAETFDHLPVVNNNSTTKERNKRRDKARDDFETNSYAWRNRVY